MICFSIIPGFPLTFRQRTGHHKLFQVEEHFPYICHFQKPSSLFLTVMVSPSERSFLKLYPDYLLTSFYLPSYLVICSLCMGYSLFTQGKQENRCDTKSDVIAVLLGGLSVSETRPSDPTLLNTPDNLFFCH